MTTIVDLEVSEPKNADNAQKSLEGIAEAGRDAAASSDQASQSFDLLGSVLQGVGQSIGQFVIDAFAQLGKNLVSSITQVAEYEQVLFGLEAALERNSSKFRSTTADDIEAFADHLGNATLTSQEAVIEVSRNLVNAAAISEENLFRTLTAAQDFAEGTGKSLETVSTSLANPERAIRLLTQAGIGLRAEQEELVKSLVDTGREAEALDIVLSQIEGSFAGAGEAAAQSLAGSLDTLGEEFNDLLRAFGTGAQEPLAELVNNIILGLGELEGLASQVGEFFGEVLARGIELGSQLAHSWGPIQDSVQDFFQSIDPATQALILDFLKSLRELSRLVFRTIIRNVSEVISALGDFINFVEGPIQVVLVGLSQALDVAINALQRFRILASDQASGDITEGLNSASDAVQRLTDGVKEAATQSRNQRQETEAIATAAADAVAQEQAKNEALREQQQQLEEVRKTQERVAQEAQRDQERIAQEAQRQQDHLEQEAQARAQRLRSQVEQTVSSESNRFSQRQQIENEQVLESRRDQFQEQLNTKQESFERRLEQRREAFQQQQQATAEAFNRQQQDAQRAFQAEIQAAQEELSLAEQVAQAFQDGGREAAQALLDEQIKAQDQLNQAQASVLADVGLGNDIDKLLALQNQSPIEQQRTALEERQRQFQEAQGEAAQTFQDQQNRAQKAFDRELQDQQQVAQEVRQEQQKNFEENVLHPLRLRLQDELQAQQLGFETRLRQGLEEQVGLPPESQPEPILLIPPGLGDLPVPQIPVPQSAGFPGPELPTPPPGAFQTPTIFEQAGAIINLPGSPVVDNSETNQLLGQLVESNNQLLTMAESRPMELNLGGNTFINEPDPLDTTIKFAQQASKMAKGLV
jgi:hypothetical protein